MQEEKLMNICKEIVFYLFGPAIGKSGYGIGLFFWSTVIEFLDSPPQC